MVTPTEAEEKENKGTVRLTSKNWDAIWKEVAKQRKEGGTPSFNSVINEAVEHWRKGDK